ncbi:MAG: oxygenase MpaB family protein [Acidimicrobiia bacterium]
MGDTGFFGPDSMMWRVNKEVTTLFGGARALLMQAAHPLVAAGARQTGAYRRHPWARLIRTATMQSQLTFGTRRSALEVADRINRLHAVIKGIDPVTGEWYDALDYDQLLWVHAALEVSVLDFYRLTIGELTPDELERYHQENLTAAEMLLLPRWYVPGTYRSTRRYVEDVIGSGRLLRTDVADEVSNLIVSGAVPTRIKPLWAFVSLAAIGTLDPRLRHLYGLSWSPVKATALDWNLAAMRRGLPLAPRRLRTISPARWAEALASPPHAIR